MKIVRKRLAILSSHPVQYYAPLFRQLAVKCDVHVFYAHRATPEQQAEAGFGAKFEWDVDLTSGYSHSWLKNVSKSPGTSTFSGCDTPEIEAELRAGRFDALLVMGWHLKCMIQGMWAAKRAGLRLMVRGDSQLSTPRSLVKRIVKEAAYPPFLKSFDAALFVGLRNKSYFEHYRFPPERLYHSPHCVDTDRFKRTSTQLERDRIRTQLGVSPNTRLILFAGKLLPFKRPLDVVETAHLLNQDGIRTEVLVAGSGELAEQLQACAGARSVGLHLLGFQNQTEMPAVYAASDALMLPSTGRETWGLVCNEALACARPIVVSSQVGCSPDLAADGVAGRAFQHASSSSAAAAFRALFNDPPDPEIILQLSKRHSLDAAANGIVHALSGAPNA